MTKMENKQRDWFGHRIRLEQNKLIIRVRKKKRDQKDQKNGLRKQGKLLKEGGKH